MLKQDRYNEIEKGVIKATFYNEDLLRSLQKMILQLPLTAVDLANLELVKKNESSRKILKKMLLPSIEDDVPMKALWDSLGNIKFEGRMKEEVYLNIKANKLALEYLDQQLRILDGKLKKPRIRFVEMIEIDGKLDENVYIDILARNIIMGSVMGRLEALYLLAAPEKTAEELAQQASQDSNK